MIALTPTITTLLSAHAPVAIGVSGDLSFRLASRYRLLKQGQHFSIERPRVILCQRDELRVKGCGDTDCHLFFFGVSFRFWHLLLFLLCRYYNGILPLLQRRVIIAA